MENSTTKLPQTNFAQEFKYFYGSFANKSYFVRSL